MQELVRVSLDAMGGDFAPQVTVQGAVEAVQQKDNVKVFLVWTSRCHRSGAFQIYL